ncbi:outer membrane protein assembly factor BamB family protein [Neolewinella persica]|uniref:outer membrane protein assembly factor BamB family protein n=1 Tax=Neolewinella persica TaxID=70998 RepID=UPI0003A6DE10|nr:PQQ-binding-like beta-propeller repeat protein [Neolewinella persica]
MRIHFFLLASLFLGMSTLSYAQVLEPIAETPLEADAKNIFTNTATGIPVLQTPRFYMGMSPKDGTILWQVERNIGASLSEMADSDGENKDFDEIPNTPLVFAGGNLLNVISGKIIINGTENDLRRLRTFYVLPDQDLILMEIAGKGAIYLYGVDPFENVQKWGVQLREASGLSMTISEDNPGLSSEDLKPQLNAAGDLIYDNGKYLALIDMKSGELKWNEKINAGYIFTNQAGNRMVIAEARGGLGGMMAAVPGSGSSSGQKFGKKLHLIDTETGQSVWKKEKKLDGNVLYVTPYDGGFLVVHDEGMNIYTFDDAKGDGRWKKDYSEKGVVNVEQEAEGLMIYFKSKRMLVDPVSGDDKWKKAEKLEKESKGFLWGLASNYEPEVRQIGKHKVTFNSGSITIGEGYRAPSYPFTWIVEEEDRIVVVIPEPTEGTRIGKPRFIATAIELGGEEVETNREYFGLKKGLAAFDKVDGGYFFYNDRGYVLMNYNPQDGFSDNKDEWYPDPTATLRTLTAIATAAGGMAYAGAQSANMVTSAATTGDVGGSVNRYNNRMGAANAASDASFGFATDRKVNGRIDEEYAFFFARDGQEGATLFKVDKNTGEEVNKYRFDDLTPLYEIDYLNGRLYYQANKTFKIFLIE